MADANLRMSEYTRPAESRRTYLLAAWRLYDEAGNRGGKLACEHELGELAFIEDFRAKTSNFADELLEAETTSPERRIFADSLKRLAWRKFAEINKHQAWSY